MVQLGTLRKTCTCTKFSSLSAPTKIEELTAGSDEKNTAERATRIRKILGSIPGGAALCFFFV